MEKCEDCEHKKSIPEGEYVCKKYDFKLCEDVACCCDEEEMGE